MNIIGRVKQLYEKEKYQYEDTTVVGHYLQTNYSQPSNSGPSGKYNNETREKQGFIKGKDALNKDEKVKIEYTSESRLKSFCHPTPLLHCRH